MNRSPTSSLIIGCGYLGTALVRVLIELGRPIVALTKTRRRQRELKALGANCHCWELSTLIGDLVIPDHGEAGLNEIGRPAVYFLLPPSTFNDANTIESILSDLLDELARIKPLRAILVSSTAVYSNDGTVSAETAVSASSPRAEKLLRIEHAWRHPDIDTRILRLAGLYGPGRIIGRSAIEAGSTIPGDAQAVLNLIHVEDAARLLATFMLSRSSAPIELGSDGVPLIRQTYYEAVAKLLGATPPPFEGATGAAASTRRCDPSSTIERTGWRPRHLDFQAAIKQALAG